MKDSGPLRYFSWTRVLRTDWLTVGHRAPLHTTGLRALRNPAFQRRPTAIRLPLECPIRVPILGQTVGYSIQLRNTRKMCCGLVEPLCVMTSFRTI